MGESFDYFLRYRRDDDTWNEIEISDSILIGSANDTHIRINEPGVLPYEKRLERKQDGVWLIDLREENGKAGSQNEGLKKLSHGDEFQIGDFSFTFFDQKMQDEKFSDTSNKTINWMLARAPYIAGGLILFAIVIFLFFLLIYRQVIVLPSANTQTVETMETAPVSRITETSGQEENITVQPTEEFEAHVNLTPSAVAGAIDINPPGIGDIDISPIVIDINKVTIENAWNTIATIDQGTTLDILTKITGENIGYVYKYIGLKYESNENEQVVITIDRSYIASENENQLEGEQLPEWGTEIPVSIEWKPEIYQLSDGTENYLAPVYPADYSSTYKDEYLYTINGIYQSIDNGQNNFAKIYFDQNGQMMNILGYRYSEGEFRAPFDINPKMGDNFTILLEYFVFEEYQDIEKIEEETQIQIPQELEDIINDQFDNLPQEINEYLGEGGQLPYGKGRFENLEGGTLTYGEQGFYWFTNPDYTGQFVAGIVVEDLDHNYYAAYVPVFVE